MVKFTVDISRMRKRLGKLKVSMAPGVVLRVIGARLEGFVDESFKTRGRGSWRPLAASTIATGGQNPLQRTGRLKQSYVTTTDGQTFVQIGSKLPIAAVHEFGTGPYTIRVRNATVLAARKVTGDYAFFGKEVNHPGVPARPVLPTKDQAEIFLIPLIEALMERAVDGEG
jgi:phage gpG-like protein